MLLDEKLFFIKFISKKILNAIKIHVEMLFNELKKYDKKSLHIFKMVELMGIF